MPALARRPAVVRRLLPHRVLSVTEDGGDLRTEAEVPEQPSGLGWLPDGRMLVVSQRDQRILRREPDGTLETHADLSDDVSGQLNDMIVDASGRAWVGNFGFDLMGGRRGRTDLARTASTPTGRRPSRGERPVVPERQRRDQDGRTLLVDETFGNRVSAFDIADDGGLGHRRVWAAFGPLPSETDLDKALGELAVAPDGCALDAEGCLWIADALGGRAIRVREGGEIVDEVSPGTGVYACGLGGADGRTLFLCCAPDFLEHNRRAAREGAILATRSRSRTADCPDGQRSSTRSVGRLRRADEQLVVAGCLERRRRRTTRRPDSTAVTQVWQTPVRHDHCVGTSHASASSSTEVYRSDQAAVRPERAKVTAGPAPGVPGGWCGGGASVRTTPGLIGERDPNRSRVDAGRIDADARRGRPTTSSMNDSGPQT